MYSSPCSQAQERGCVDTPSQSMNVPVSLGFHFCETISGHKGDITIPCPRRLTPLHVLRRRRHLRRRNRFLHCRRLCELHHFQLVTGIRGENKLLSLWVEYTFSFQYLLSSVVNINSFLAGFLAQANAVERVPSIILMVHGRWRKLNGCCFIVAEIQHKGPDRAGGSASDEAS